MLREEASVEKPVGGVQSPLPRPDNGRTPAFVAQRASSEEVQREPWQDQWPTRSAWLKRLERLFLLLERPVNRLVGKPLFNPLYHTGPIALFLLVLVGLSGLYVTFFGYDFGFTASYQGVVRVEDQLIGRLIRAVHRYASGALVITSLIHALRLLAMGRFRGPRWLAWVSGVAMVVLVWLAGVTGYWLVWDRRAQLITTGLTGFLRRYTPWGTAFALGLRSAAATERDWVVMLLLFAAHLLAFALIALFVWLHILRLHRPRLLPEPRWLAGIGLVFLVAAALFPVELLPHADFSRLPRSVSLDPLFLFFLPAVLKAQDGWLWVGLLLVTAVATAIPWLPRRRSSPPRVHIRTELCTGCTTCAEDCPYKAITMVPRADGKPHKLVAVANPDLCVSCGICVGSCKDHAISLGELSVEAIGHAVQARLRQARRERPGQGVRLVFTCERHVAQEARPYQEQPASIEGGRVVEVISLPCVGAVHADLVGLALEAGAAEVQVVGCPPEDCSHREGNHWTEARLTRQRLPRLKRDYIGAPISMAWMPPGHLAQALQADVPPLVLPTHREEEASESAEALSLKEQLLAALRPRYLLPALLLLGVALLLQIQLTRFPFRPYTAGKAVVQIALPDPARPFGLSAAQPASDRMARWPTRLVLEVDGRVPFERSYSPAVLFSGSPPPLFEEVWIAPGQHHLRLSFENDQHTMSVVLFDQTVTLDDGRVLTLGYEGDKCTNLSRPLPDCVSRDRF
ncbi:MAG: hydrogenase iron-sulfur subunit [Chloroflexi bacterium]|nr:MAG: hydrogenase iron-sulfur subunit [Chloroflexota bacterium]